MMEGDCQLLKDGPFGEGLGLPFGSEAVADVLQDFVGGGKEGPTGAESVFEGILAGGGLAFGSDGAGGALGVTPVGFNLFFRCHGMVLLMAG